MLIMLYISLLSLDVCMFSMINLIVVSMNIHNVNTENKIAFSDPSEPPIISGFADGGEYTVIEGRPGYLSCLVKGGNPMPTLSWDCYNSGDRGFINGLSTLTVTKGQGWLAKLGNDKPCTCISSQNLETKSVSVNIVTLCKLTLSLHIILMNLKRLNVQYSLPFNSYIC